MSWSKTLAPILQKLDVAAKFNGKASWNAVGSAALADVLRKMIDIIENQIEGRREGQVNGQLHAREISLYGSTANDWSKEELLLVVEWQMLGNYRTTDGEPRRQALQREIVRIAKERRRDGRPDRKAAQEG